VYGEEEISERSARIEAKIDALRVRQLAETRKTPVIHGHFYGLPVIRELADS
jgi:hypothetical protein